MVLEPEKKKKQKIKGGLGWIRGQEQGMSSPPCNGNHFSNFKESTEIVVTLQCQSYIKTTTILPDAYWKASVASETLPGLYN